MSVSAKLQQVLFGKLIWWDEKSPTMRLSHKRLQRLQERNGTRSKTHLQPTYAPSTVISINIHLRLAEHGKEDIAHFQFPRSDR